MTSYWIRGDTRVRLAEMAAAGIVWDLAVGSPPFLRQREYLPADHPDKHLEMGGERNPGEFIDGLLDVAEALDAGLAAHGSIAFELGDKSAGSGGAGGDYNPGGLRDGQPRFGSVPARTNQHGSIDRGGPQQASCAGDHWPAAKSLCLLPELFRVSLAYGRNPLTGRVTSPWRVRNVVSWCRTNPPVGDDGDKLRRGHSDIVIACRTDEAGRRRYWDSYPVRVPARYGEFDQDRPGTAAAYHPPGQPPRNTRVAGEQGRINAHPAGAPLLDWWVISASGYPGAHYATYPPALVEPLIKTMCPTRVCTTCGEPSRRVVERTGVGAGTVRSRQPGHERTLVSADVPDHADPRSVGWTDCGHDTWRPGIVLDPFAGSGTTLAVATGHGRIGIGVDLDERNTELARDRVGPFLFREVTVNELAVALGTGSKGRSPV